MKRNRSGFAGIAVILVLLALAAIGGVAYVHYVYLPQMATQNNTVTQPESASSTIQSPPVQPSISNQVSILYPADGASFTVGGLSKAIWTDASSNSGTKYVVLVTAVKSAAYNSGTQVLFTTLDLTQAGCAAGNKCSYPISVTAAGTYRLSVTDQDNGASATVTFVVGSTSIKANPPAAVVTPPAPLSNNDCGTINAENYDFQSNKFISNDAASVAAAGCAVKALVSCADSAFAFSTNEAVQYIKLEKDGENCAVKGKLVSLKNSFSPEVVLCKVPVTQLAFTSQADVMQNPTSPANMKGLMQFDISMPFIAAAVYSGGSTGGVQCEKSTW